METTTQEISIKLELEPLEATKEPIEVACVKTENIQSKDADANTDTQNGQSKVEISNQTDPTTEELIELVKCYDCLYNYKCPEYKEMTIKNKAWKIIASKINKTVDETKSMWKNLRDGHRQSINIKKKKDPHDFRTKWRYEKQMTFMIPFYKKSRNFQVEDELKLPNDYWFQDFMDEIHSKALKVEEEKMEQEENRRTRKSIKRQFTETPAKAENCSTKKKKDIKTNSKQKQNSNVVEVKETDIAVPKVSNRTALEIFFLSMSDTTSMLPEYLQVRVQRQVFNNVMEAKEQHLMASNINNEYSTFVQSCQTRSRPSSTQSSYVSPDVEAHYSPPQNDPLTTTSNTSITGQTFTSSDTE